MPINYTLVIRENTEAEEIVCATSMVKAVEFNDETQLAAFQLVCGQIGIEYGDFDYRYELYAAR
jgi:hypothetical protein